MDLGFLPVINWVDIIVAVFLLRGAYIGLNRGFSVELFKVLGTLASTVLSLLFYNKLGQWIIIHSFLSLQAANFLSFLILFFVLLLIFKVVRMAFFKILHIELFGDLEKWAGFTLGLGRSLIYASLFLFALTLLPVKYLQRSVEERSLSAPYLRGIAPRVLDFIVRFKPKPEEEKDDHKKDL